MPFARSKHSTQLPIGHHHRHRGGGGAACLVQVLSHWLSLQPGRHWYSDRSSLQVLKHQNLDLRSRYVELATSRKDFSQKPAKPARFDLSLAWQKSSQLDRWLTRSQMTVVSVFLKTWKLRHWLWPGWPQTACRAFRAKTEPPAEHPPSFRTEVLAQSGPADCSGWKRLPDWRQRVWQMPAVRQPDHPIEVQTPVP